MLGVAAAAVFYLLQPKTADEAPVAEEEARAEDEIVPLEEADMTEGIGEALTVSIAGFKFVPESVSVRAGESVTWKNNEAGVPHSIELDDGSYKSAAVFAGETETRRFPVVGTYPYHCGIHPSMKGVVVVR